MISSINRDGTVRDRLSITLDGMRAFYADMVEARTYDHMCMVMQQQRRPAAYAPFVEPPDRAPGPMMDILESRGVVGPRTGEHGR